MIRYRTIGISLIEVLVSLTILSTVMLTSLTYTLHCIKLTQNSLWDTGSISSFSSFFERAQLYSKTLRYNSGALDTELNSLNKDLKTHAPFTFAKIGMNQNDEAKLIMVRENNRDMLKVTKVEAIIQ